MNYLHDNWNKFQRWCRLIILVHEGGESVCKDILSKMGIKDITDGAAIYRKMKLYEKKLKTMSFYLQETLLPDNKVVDASKIDISLCTHIIEILDTTQSYPLIAKLRRKRNELLNMPEEKRDMTEKLFNNFWENILQLLEYHHYDTKLMKDLKTEDHLSQQHEKTLTNIIHSINGSVKLVS